MTIFNLELKKNVSSLQTLKSKQNDFIIVKKATPKFRFLQTKRKSEKPLRTQTSPYFPQTFQSTKIK